MVAVDSEDRQAHMESIAVEICLPAISEGVIKFVLCPLLRSQQHQRESSNLYSVPCCAVSSIKCWPGGLLLTHPLYVICQKSGQYECQDPVG